MRLALEDAGPAEYAPVPSSRITGGSDSTADQPVAGRLPRVRHGAVGRSVVQQIDGRALRDEVGEQPAR
ncbi:MAG: hypothetical protein MZV65_39770 [Chromatiales bacterium]|nr:hypothetical protein [Chromatiales bacterium]